MSVSSPASVTLTMRVSSWPPQAMSQPSGQAAGGVLALRAAFCPSIDDWMAMIEAMPDEGMYNLAAPARARTLA